MKRKCLAVGIILLFVGTCIIPAIAQDTEKPLPTPRGNWLYVGGSGPGNYTRIQDAIDNASNGDTVFVYDDSSPYYETVQTSRSINLIGENTNTTTINDTDIYAPVLKIVKDNVLVTGFTIIGKDVNFKPGIDITSDNNIIYGNNISSGVGIHLQEANNNSIFKNIISGNSYDGILGGGSYLKIENNTIFSKGWGCGIYLYNNYHAFFHNNLFVQTTTYPCIRLMGGEWASQTVISNNTLQNGVLWYMDGPSNDIVSNNTVNGKPLVFLYNVSDRLIDYDAGQVIIGRCDNITIANQNFSNLEYPLQIHDSMNCTIIDSMISNAKRYKSIEIFNSDNIVVMNNKIKSTQIEFSYCDNISFSKNTMTNSLEGINFGGCTNRTISYNNLIDNFFDLTFRYECRNCSVYCNNFRSHKLINKPFNIHFYDPVSSHNTVKRNYWERPRLLPKLILVRIYEGDWAYPNETKGSFYFDWRPALKPYVSLGVS